jgi:feruloyl-CoA synthase
LKSVPVQPSFGPREVRVERRADGCVLVRSPVALEPYPARLTDCLAQAVVRHPDRIFLAVRTPELAWRSVTYRQSWDAVRRIAAALLERDLSAERPVAILSGSSIEHAWLALAAMLVGIPFAPLSPAYSLSSPDLERLKYILQLLTPGLVFARDGASFAHALTRAVAAETQIVVTQAPPAGRRATLFAELLGTRSASSDAAVDAAHARIGPDTVAKVLFTSGSTGTPKGVMNTHRMLCCNQQMFAQALPLTAEEPLVLVDWLPWHHTSGGNQILGLTLYHGGTLYIDEGRPLPEQIEPTLRNLREISPTLYFTVPRGYAELIPHLRADRTLCESLFARVRMFYYSGAPIAHAVMRQLEEIGEATCGRRIPFLCGYGSTETAPFSLCTNWLAERSGLAGLPVPGVELKLLARGAKLEACIRGPNVMPGYWRQAQLTRDVLDAEGFLHTGDALSWVDADDPTQGLAFDGRIAEDFKLTTGTWVHTGALRARLIAAAGTAIHDAVIAGEGRDEVGALVFANAALARAGEDIQRALDRLAAESTGTSTFIARALLLEEPPNAAAGEVTDKGSINQRAVLKRRADLVEELYREPASVRVLRARR